MERFRRGRALWLRRGAALMVVLGAGVLAVWGDIEITLPGEKPTTHPAAGPGQFGAEPAEAVPGTLPAMPGTLPGGTGTQPGAGAVGPPAGTAPATMAATGPIVVTDARVLAAMEKGVNFLLGAKKGDNFETGADFARPSQRGGETALALYALLHVGRSLEDPRLYYKSAELAPAIKWLEGIRPDATYVAALQANALALVPRKPESDAALGRDRDFLFGAMGADGGYSYGKPGGGDYNLRVSWQNYYALKMGQRLGDQTLADAKSQLDGAARQQKLSYGGLDGEFKVIAEEIRERGKAAMQANDRVAANRAAAELADLQKYADEARRFVVTQDFQQELADAKQSLTEALQHLRSGDPEHKKTAVELKEDVAIAQWRVGLVEWEMKHGIRPAGDLSNGQYGTLGAWALADAGVEIPVSYWQVSDRFWRTTQLAKGTWGYLPDGTVLGEEQYDSMGVAGIASLFITTEYTDLTLRNVPRPDASLDRGLAWLDANFKPETGNYYYLYGVERVGLASGLKFFGTTNWYREGAKGVLARQKADGSWDGGFIGANPVVATCYALLFLARGRDPVVFNKLDYDGAGVAPGLWNVRPRDDANVTGWMSKKFERPINWQVVNLQVAAEEWLDAPILLITGSRDPKFKAADVAKLRAFVEAGGVIFSVAESGQEEFTSAMRRYAGQVVENRYEMKDIAKDHPIFNLWTPIANPPRMLGMSNGERLLWVHSPVDMSASWQRKLYAVKDHFEIPANLYFYATGKGSLRTKLQPLAVTASAEPAVRTITVARLEYAGNWDPEPGAWPRLAKLAQADFHTKVRLVTLKAAGLKASAPTIVHITGTGAFTLPAEDVAALREYVAGGGTVLADAGGGSAEFTASMQQLIKEIGGGGLLLPLEPDHALYKGAYAEGVNITRTVFRPYALLKEGRMDGPRLQAVMMKDRPAILFSGEDITSGLLGTNTWGIVGYTPESAERLVRDVLLYVTEPHGAAAAAATMPGGN